MYQVLSTLLEESDDVHQEILDLLLSGLLPPRSEDNAALYE